jgi:hypothetical protein
VAAAVIITCLSTPLESTWSILPIPSGLPRRILQIDSTITQRWQVAQEMQDPERDESRYSNNSIQ